MPVWTWACLAPCNHSWIHCVLPGVLSFRGAKGPEAPHFPTPGGPAWSGALLVAHRLCCPYPRVSAVLFSSSPGPGVRVWPLRLSPHHSQPLHHRASKPSPGLTARPEYAISRMNNDSASLLSNACTFLSLYLHLLFESSKGSMKQILFFQFDRCEHHQSVTEGNQLPSDLTGEQPHHLASVNEQGEGMVSLFFTLPQGPCCALPEFGVCSDPPGPRSPNPVPLRSSSVGLHTRPQAPGLPVPTPIPSPLLTASPPWTADLQVIPPPSSPAAPAPSD